MKGETKNAVKAGSEIIHSRYYVHFIYTTPISTKSAKGNHLGEANWTSSNKCIRKETHS
jgi:hypothetical protein